MSWKNRLPNWAEFKQTSEDGRGVVHVDPDRAYPEVLRKMGAISPELELDKRLSNQAMKIAQHIITRTIRVIHFLYLEPGERVGGISIEIHDSTVASKRWHIHSFPDDQRLEPIFKKKDIYFEELGLDVQLGRVARAKEFLGKIIE